MSVYKSYSQEQLENIASNYLISSWSYSKVTQFSRNQKAFEMAHIYGYKFKNSATTIAGQAYHFALQWFFQKLKDGEELSFIDAQTLAYNYIDEVDACNWKLQKTAPSVEECISKANKTVNALIENFFGETSSYIGELEEVLDVEIHFSEFLTINGVDIPLKANGLIDLVIKLKDGRIIIVDHKSKEKYTPEDEIKFSIGKQAIVYYNAYLSKKGIKADEVWFAENKTSKNKNGDNQIQVTKIKFDDDVVRLYEALLYEPLKKMFDAISDPDFIYVINDSDSFVDKAEIYDFWAKTMIAEISEFNIEEDKKDLIEKRLKKIKDSSLASINPKIIKDFRKQAKDFIQFDISNMDGTPKEKIEHVLRHKNLSVKVAHVLNGYSSDTFLLEFGASVNINTIFKHKLDIASALNVSNIRIAPNLKLYEGGAYLAIEVSKKRDRDLLWDKSEIIGMKIPLGKDNLGNTIYWDLESHSTPHQLVGGSTGSGKSVYIRSILESVSCIGVNEVHIFDPKLEFLDLSNSTTKVYDDVDNFELILESLVEKMEAKIRSKDNSLVFIVFDEYADAIESAGRGNKIDHYLKRILQKGRSSGFRVLAATQRASVKIISGDIKVNFPIQVCFRVPKEIDSKVMIDEGGAELLSGLGDGLIKSPDLPDVVRFQSFYKP